MMTVAPEFLRLFEILPQSGCAKRQTAAGTYVGGIWREATNFCIHEGEECPRLYVPSGTHYELCQSHHAESNLAESLKKDGQASDGIAWIASHYWICEPCASALKDVGVREFRVMETPGT